MIEPIARVRIELQETEPSVWRRVDVPLSATLFALHDVIQVVMGWKDAHLFEFVVGDRTYAEPHGDDAAFGRKVFKAKSIRLQTLVDRGVTQFIYAYDFGDDWRHDVIIEEVRDGTPDVDYPAFIDGARRGPPEDVGGVHGFADFLEAIRDPGHEEHAQLLRWYGGPFDPDDIGEAHIRNVLAMLADRRKGPLASRRNGAGRKRDHPM